jgi:manganese/iron transport system substrate-binding protein
MVAVIAEGLTQIQPDFAEKYNAQTQTIQAELEQIDQWIQQQISTIPPNQRKLVMSHNALGYYVQHYNLEFQGALSGISTDESPSAGMVADLVKEIKQTQVPTIFPETSVNPQLIETVAREANVQLSPRELYTDSLGSEGSEGDSYQKMLIANTITIVEGLGGQYAAFNPK